MKNNTNPTIDTLPNSDNAGLGCLCVGGGYFIMNEVWKDVKGYEGHYMVSNIGRMRTLKLGGDKIMIPIINGAGYPCVNLCKNGKPKQTLIHVIIAMAFLKHIPCRYKLVADHVDNNKLNNNIENIKIVTVRENSSKDRKNCTSRFTGVSWNKRRRKWVSNIWINGRLKYMGGFTKEFDAHLAYQNELKKLK